MLCKPCFITIYLKIPLLSPFKKGGEAREAHSKEGVRPMRTPFNKGKRMEGPPLKRGKRWLELF